MANASYPYAVTGTEEIDPLTGKPKKPPEQLPTWDNTVQSVPLQPGNQNATAQGNEAVMQAAQQKSLQGQQGGTLSSVVASTQNLLKDPNMGKNFAQEKSLALEQQNRNMNQQLETLRQQTAPTAYTGQNLRDLTNVAMQNVQQRADTSRQIDIEQSKAQRENLISALAEGRSTAAQERGAFDQDIQNLLATRGAYEGEAGRAQELSVLDKTYGQEIAKMVMAQDWEGGQAALDREAAILAQSTDINAKQAFQDKQNAFDMAKLNATQDWQGAQNKISQDLQLAMQSNDINAAAANIQKQLDLDKWKQENGQVFTAEQNALNRALETSLKTMDIESSKNLMELKNKIDMGYLAKQQDFEAIQSDLDRQLQTAIQNNDIQAQYTLKKMQADIDKAAQTAEQEFVRNERISTQSYLTNERISGQDYDTATKLLEQKNALAMQANDIQAQKDIADQKGKLDLLMQTNSMKQQEKMAYLDNELTTARADGDVERQKTILSFQFGQEMEQVRQAQGFEAAQALGQQNFQLAMQNNDFTQAKVMLDLQQSFQADQAGKDRALEEAKLAMQKAGLDFDRMQQTYALLSEQDPAAAFSYLQKQVTPLGITLKATDATTIAKEAIKADFEAQKYQWALTHPNMWDKTTGDLTADGQKQFYEQFNAAINGEVKPDYQNIIQGISDIAELRGGFSTSSPNRAAYFDVLSKAPAWTPQMAYSSGGMFGVDQRSISNVPAKNQVFVYNGKLYQAISDKAMQTSGENTEYFKVIDVNTGETRTISVSGNSNSNLAIQGF